MTTEKRIEKEADAVASKWLEVQYSASKTSYIEGAKSERNKAINECVDLLLNAPQTSQWRDDAKDHIRVQFEKLKV